ncbi:MAG TPA: hypothetical protein VFI23_02605 [Rhizomicrobium sp.]|nr:hypothetical protein [Rhizomicrobium sp.]
MAQDLWEMYGLPPEPISDKAVWNSAQRLLRHYGERAAPVAEKRGSDALDLGELFDSRYWRLVAEAVREMQRTKLVRGEAKN